MSGLCDLRELDMTDAERLALCAELERLNSLPPGPAELASSPCEVERAGLGDHINHGDMA